MAVTSEIDMSLEKELQFDALQLALVYHCSLLTDRKPSSLSHRCMHCWRNHLLSLPPNDNAVNHRSIFNNMPDQKGYVPIEFFIHSADS